jgi:hypothetical protein
MTFRTLTSITAIVLFAALAISVRVGAEEKQDRPFPPNVCVLDCFDMNTLSFTSYAAQSRQRVFLNGTGVPTESCRVEGEECNESEHEDCCPGLRCQIIYVGPCRATGAGCPGFCLRE